MLLKPLPITLSALLLLGGGTAFAAEQALPTQVLYPIKIQVNERVRAALTPTTEGKARWETEVAARRLDEAEKLAAENKLHANVQTEIATNFDEQARLVERKITALKTEGNADAAIKLSADFQTLLQAHQEIVTQLTLDVQAKEAAEKNNQAQADAKAETNATTDQKTDISVNDQVDLKFAADKKQHEANDALLQAKAILAATTITNVDLKTKFTALIAASGNELTQGNAAFNQADFKIALDHFTQADDIAEEIRLLLKTTTPIKFELPLDLKIDDQTGLKKTETSSPVSKENIDQKTLLENETKTNLDSQTSITNKEASDETLETKTLQDLNVNMKF